MQDLMRQGGNQPLIFTQQRGVCFVKASRYVIGLQLLGREAVPDTLFYVSSYCNEYTHHLPTNGIALQQSLFRIKIFSLSIASAYDKQTIPLQFRGILNACKRED